jgi:hypothetical protein
MNTSTPTETPALKVRCGDCRYFVRDGKCSFFQSEASKAPGRPFAHAPFWVWSDCYSDREQGAGQMIRPNASEQGVREGVGASLSATGLSQVEPQEGLAPPGFDPSRIGELQIRCEAYDDCLRTVCHHLQLPQSDSGPCDRSMEARLGRRRGRQTAPRLRSRQRGPVRGSPCR